MKDHIVGRLTTGEVTLSQLSLRWCMVRKICEKKYFDSGGYTGMVPGGHKGKSAWAQRSKHSDPIPREGWVDDRDHESFKGWCWLVDMLAPTLSLSYLLLFVMLAWTAVLMLVKILTNILRRVWMSYCVKELSGIWSQAVFVNVTFQTHLKHKLWLMLHFEP